MTRRSSIMAVGLLVLAGCSQGGEGDKPIAATSEQTNGTVAATVAASADHRKLAAALTDTQLGPVLDGKGAYTLLAPDDTAFDALGDKGDALAGKDRRPLMIAVLRAHLLPGEVTPEAIEKAIAREKGPVEMRTMAGGTVRFSKGRRGIVVGNGETEAALSGTAQTASNGAMLPIDKVLLPPA
jgi:uncharacterized surface protein with fasciclin (FAS1) repeats